MLESPQQTEKLNSGGLDPVVVSDRELNGDINRSTAQGAKFSLLLAMLEQNNIHRPRFPTTTEEVVTEKSILHYYRSSPLVAEAGSWEYLQQTSVLVNSGDLQNAQLWLVMHPEPLSQFNNPTHLERDIVANCSYPTQTRLQQEQDHTIKVDETGLYDILQELSSSAA